MHRFNVLFRISMMLIKTSEESVKVLSRSLVDRDSRRFKKGNHILILVYNPVFFECEIVNQRSKSLWEYEDESWVRDLLAIFQLHKSQTQSFQCDEIQRKDMRWYRRLGALWHNNRLRLWRKHHFDRIPGRKQRGPSNSIPFPVGTSLDLDKSAPEFHSGPVG